MELGRECSDIEKLENHKKAANRMFSVDCLLSYGGGAESFHYFSSRIPGQRTVY